MSTADPQPKPDERAAESSPLPTGAFLFNASSRRLIGSSQNGTPLEVQAGSCSLHIETLLTAIVEDKPRKQFERLFAVDSAPPASAKTTALDSSKGQLITGWRMMLGVDSAVLVVVSPAAGRENQIRRDPLTNLPDREAARECGERWLGSADCSAADFALLFLDLNDFKHVNDEYGHGAGDVVLQELAQRWRDCLREGDFVARYGGDEFLVLLKSIRSHEDAQPIITRIINAADRPIRTTYGEFRVAVSVGVALSCEHKADVLQLIALADRDMYSKKRMKET